MIPTCVSSCVPYFTRNDLSTFSPVACLGITSYFFMVEKYCTVYMNTISSVQSVQSLSHARLFVTPWIAACQASLSITNSWISLKLTSIESVMPSSHLILCHPLLLLPPIPPNIRVFSNESALRIRWPKYWSFSFSISPSMNIQDWFPLGWTGWISFSPRDSQESSPTLQFKSINSLVLSFLYIPTLTSIHDYWKNHSLDYMNLCWQSNVSVF